MSGYRVTVHTDDGRKYHFQRSEAFKAKALARYVLANGVHRTRQGVTSYYPPYAINRVKIEAAKQ